MNASIDKRTSGYKRRVEAVQSKPQVVSDLLDHALNKGMLADYVLMDSWFTYAPLIQSITEKGLFVIGMVKQLKQRYQYEGERLTLPELYRKAKPAMGKKDLLGSIHVTLDNGIPAKILFIRNRHKRSEWLTILSTDTTLDNEEIVRIYGMRWDIEVFFNFQMRGLTPPSLDGGVRPRIWKLKKVMRRGDTLFVHSLDRFGRNKEQILEEWRELTKEKGINIVVVDMPLLDTRKYKDSMGSLITDIVLQLLSWLAEEERNKIRKRQREGIDIALKNGVRFGRQPAQITPEFETAYKKWRAGEIKAVEAMKEANLKKSTFYKLVKQYES